MVETKRKEGWYRPGNSRKFHYFVEGRSLCRGWGLIGSPDFDPDTGNTKRGEEDCAGCFRGLVKRREQASRSG